MSPRAGSAGHPTLAFVESPVQLLNVLEWAHAHALGAKVNGTPGHGAAIPAQGRRSGAGRLTAPADGAGAAGPTAVEGLTLVVLSPTDPMTRGQLRRMAEL